MFCLLVILTLTHEGDAAKGGAKSIMRNRKGQQGAAGQSFLGYYGHNSNFGDRGNNGEDSWDDYDGSGDDFGDGSGSGEDYQEEFTCSTLPSESAIHVLIDWFIQCWAFVGTLLSSYEVVVRIT